MAKLLPTVGRVVYFHPASHKLLGFQVEGAMIRRGDQPFDAHIVFVWSYTCVNLVVFDHNGNMHKRTSVPINQGNTGGSYAEWMPYQVGQAAKVEAGQLKRPQQ